LDPLAQVSIARAQAALSIAASGTGDRTLARDFVRSRIALAVSRSQGIPPVQYAAQRWGVDSEVPIILRSGVAATDADDVSRLGAAGAASEAFFARVREASIVGRLGRARRVGFNVRTLTPGTGASGFWVGEAKAIPLSRAALEGAELPHRKVAGLVVTSNEALADPASEDRVVEDLVTACAHVLDEAFTGDQAGTADVPAGLLHDVAAVISLGDPARDLADLVDAFDGDLATAAVLTDPTTAVQIALVGGQAFQGLGATGGTALGMPWYTSRMSPRDSDGGQIVLLDEAALALAMDGFELALSTAATLEMDDDPQADGGAPDASSANVVSLFQAELTAFRCVTRANWRLARPGAVAAIAGCDYGQES
jgi:hypothetical protein